MNIVKIVIALIIIIAVAIIGFFVSKKQAVAPTPTVSNFEECAAAGYPVMESYPRQCRTPDGKIFTELISAIPTPIPPEIIQGEKSLLYENREFGFDMWYVEGSGVRENNQEGYLSATTSGAAVVGVYLPEALFQGTNLSEAAVLVGVSPDPEAIAKCEVPVDTQEQARGTENIDGVTFSVFESTGAAAGNTYESRIFRTMRNGSCYEIVEMLHSGNIGNYPERTVREFDKPKFSGILERAAQTFVFTNNSMSGALGTVTLSPTCPVEKNPPSAGSSLPSARRSPPDPACIPQPYETAVTITKNGFSKVINSDFSGRFKVDLDVGSYQFQAKGGIALPTCAPVTVEIKDQSFVWVSISCDTGIR